jgi:hypothetical protein
MGPDPANMMPMTEEELSALNDYVSQRRNFAMNVGLNWGHFYQIQADSMMFDHRPDYGKLFYDSLRAFRPDYNQRFFQSAGGQLPASDSSNAIPLILTSLQNLPMYILYGWETGIYNEFRHLQSRGITKAQLMELVMYGNLNAGIRGLQLVYYSVGKYLPDFKDRPEPAPWPEGWAPDNAAFHAGLDLSQRRLTEQDQRNLSHWFESTIGYVPASVKFAIDYHPEFYKWHRARWEIIFQKLPKQTAPYVMIRQQLLTGFADALKEAALLGKAWGITKERIALSCTDTANYTGFENLYAAHDALDDILSNWD